MQGYEVLWLPGMDHAGIATQSVVEKQLAVDGKTKEDFGRELFIDKVWDWKHESGGTIGGQMRRLGDGVDWSRDRFTMDEGLSRAVRTIFKRMFDAGLIYRAERLVNWSPVLQIADLGHRGQVRRRRGRAGGRSGYGSLDNASRTSWWPPPASRRCSVTPRSRCTPTTSATATWSATTLPHPLLDRQLVVVADEHVDPEFGTGAVKVTPAHDPNDFEIGCGTTCRCRTSWTPGRITDTGTVSTAWTASRPASRSARRWPSRAASSREATLPAQRPGIPSAVAR